MTSHVPTLIVGGGISGLVCAHVLLQAGVDVRIVEASPRRGGLIRSERRQGYLLEMGPQSFSFTTPIRKLCEELGITADLVEAPRQAPRYVLVDGTLRPVPLTPPALLLSSLLSGGTKRSIARDMFGKSQPPEPDESVADFVRRKFSAELLDRLVGPFISGIYAGDPEQLSLRSAFPQLYEAEKSTGSIIRGLKRLAKSSPEPRQRPTLMSFREGNETLVRALSAKLGSSLRCGAKALRVATSGEGSVKKFEVVTRFAGREESLVAEHLVLATPTDIAGGLLAPLNPAFDAALAAMEYAPIAVVSLGYRRSEIENSLKGFGFLVPRSERLRVLGTVWNSSLFPGRAPEGQVLLTSFVGGATDRHAIEQLPHDLATLIHREISPVLGIKREPTFSNVEIYPRALPQYNIGHSQRLADLEQARLAIPNLWLIGNYLRGPSIGACIEHAVGVAQDVLSRLQGPAGAHPVP